MNPRLILPIALAAAVSVAFAAEPAAPATTPTKAPAPASSPVVTPPPKPATPAPTPTSSDSTPTRRRDRGDRSSNSSSRTAATPAAPASSVTPGTTLDSFRLISDRNIFNSLRTGRRERTDDPGPRLDVISLVGTIESDRGLRAIFDGSSSSYRKGLSIGGSVEKFKVTQIAPNLVDLDYDGKAMSMRVGQQLRRPDGGEWDLVAAEVVRAEAAAAAAKANEGKIDPTAPVAIPTNADEVTRRLMERRNKDLKK